MKDQIPKRDRTLAARGVVRCCRFFCDCNQVHPEDVRGDLTRLRFQWWKLVLVAAAIPLMGLAFMDALR